MGFSLEFDEVGVREYIAAHPQLTREDRVKVFRGLDALRTIADAYRLDPSRRLSTSPSRFWYDYLFRDSNGRVRRFWFVVDDSWATMGVLRVVYADEG